MTFYTVPWFPDMQGRSGRRAEMPGSAVHIIFAVVGLLRVAYEAWGIVEEKRFACWAGELLCAPESSVIGALRTANQLGLISRDYPEGIN